MTVVLPGDVVSVPSSSAIKLGPGLLPTPNATSSLTAIRPGALGQIGSSSTASKGKDAQTALWVETNTLRYVPAPGDSVIGQITNRGAESYTVTLFSAHAATLPALSFEGATKRHKPNLRIGSLVYARIVGADRFAEPELTCVNPVTGKSDGFGDLKTTDERGERVGHAMLFVVSVGLARSLLRPTHALLKQVAAHFPFEAAVGANGAVWVRANEPRHVIAVGKVLDAADLLSTHHDSASQAAHADSAEQHTHAEHVVKHRAASLDAKGIRELVAEFL
ncbi:related to RRP40-protein involved in ribosomal RNA processing, component of the exosome complex [Sporisorium reilianum f. sp. reilianum]|uniref:Ribosomal RNA-processing protein 40 n=1 Tax=Sporisorium reilianum f. sp. reilianum TaxID=72559 RepID=A0A2N8UC01_9BASI|nr:related to RRP40-protein involved in ribosomal RNA processing, component of the exosome complex [Sporisorium reilianum f. sp. reilianum]